MKIGLALSSGSLRGLSHIGVLKVLEKYNIKISYIAGSSVGALIGALYASGISANKLEKIALKTNLAELADFTFPFEGFIKGDKIESLVKKLTKNKKFSQAKIPLSIIATDITLGRKLIINKGNLAKAVRASISMPFIFKPSKLNKRIILDGGILDPLPVDIVKRMGADYVIAIDATPSFKNLENTKLNLILKEKLIEKSLKNKGKDNLNYLTLILSSPTLKNLITKKLQNTKLPYSIILTLNSIALMEKQLAKDNAKKANLVIRPSLPKMKLLSYKLTPYCINQGEKAALKYTETFIKLRSFKISK